MNEADWHPFAYELKYRLGEFTLGTKRLNVLRKVYKLGELKGGDETPKLPQLDTALDGYFLSSIPRQCDSGTIERANGYLRYCVHSYMRCHIDMSGDFAGYSEKFSGKTRSTIKRKIRKFGEQAGGVDFRIYRTPDEIDAFFRLARAVSAASYQERLLDCGLPDSVDAIDRAKAAADCDQLRAFLLFAQGEPVSYLYCPIERGVLQYAYLGFKPEIGKLSPGTVLQWLALESLFSEGKFSAFDFTEGDSEHKRFFSTDQTPCSLELLLRPDLGIRLSVMLHRQVDASSSAIGNGLERIGFKRALRNWLRKAA